MTVLIGESLGTSSERRWSEVCRDMRVEPPPGDPITATGSDMAQNSPADSPQQGDGDQFRPMVPVSRGLTASIARTFSDGC